MSDWKTDPKEIDAHITKGDEQSDAVTWEQLVNSGELDGYNETMETSIDREYAETTPCEECGGECRFEGLTNGRNSYRCFSVCNTCGRVLEF